MRPATDRPVVLVAEDGDGTRGLSCLVLESHGFVCRGAATIEAGMGLIRDDARVDLVFADIHFPGTLSGVDLARFALQPPYRIPVLLTSGLAIEFVEEILPEGIAFLEKPYTPERLLDAIHRVMQSRRDGSATSAA